MATQRQTTPALPRPSPALTRLSAHPTSTNSGNYGATPMDLLASQKAQNQRRCDERMAKGLCLYCGSADYFQNECPALAANNSRKVRLATAKISTTSTDPAPTSQPSSGKE
jgi:hypothetical protein